MKHEAKEIIALVLRKLKSKAEKGNFTKNDALIFDKLVKIYVLLDDEKKQEKLEVIIKEVSGEVRANNNQPTLFDPPKE